jgi:hypothetical protein
MTSKTYYTHLKISKEKIQDNFGDILFSAATDVLIPIKIDVALRYHHSDANEFVVDTLINFNGLPDESQALQFVHHANDEVYFRTNTMESDYGLSCYYYCYNSIGTSHLFWRWEVISIPIEKTFGVPYNNPTISIKFINDISVCSKHIENGEREYIDYDGQIIELDLSDFLPNGTEMFFKQSDGTYKKGKLWCRNSTNEDFKKAINVYCRRSTDSDWNKSI